MKNTILLALIFIFSCFGAYVGIFLGDLTSENVFRDKEVPVLAKIDSSKSKLSAVIMRCYGLEHEMDMLRLRIEELEEQYGITNECDFIPCSQYYLYQSNISTNKQ